MELGQISRSGERSAGLMAGSWATMPGGTIDVDQEAAWRDGAVHTGSFGPQ